MIDRVLRHVPGDQLQSAVGNGNPAEIHAAANLMSASQLALQKALEIIKQAGFGDVPLPSEQEQQKLEAWRQTEVASRPAGQPVTILEKVGQGFEDAAFILSIRLDEAQSSESPDPEAASKTLSHIQALGRAWAAAEEKFHTPEAKSALEAFDGKDNAYQIENLPTNNVWVEAFTNAAVAAKLGQEGITLTDNRGLPPTRRDVNSPLMGLNAGEEITKILSTGDPKKVKLELGKYLRQLRLAHNWTQAELVQGHYSVSYMSAVERGQIMPSVNALAWLLGKLR